MNEKHKKVFISYSWDSESHQQWVFDLMNRLRDHGIDATMDIVQTQNNTLNLNAMMVSGIRDNDHIIVVLTENYASKADKLEGGVGFETLLTMPLLLQNPKKLIFILRHNNYWADAFPFHLNGWFAINFSGDNLEKPFKQLLHRIEGVPLYQQRPLGPKVDLSPMKKIDEEPSMLSTDFKIPNLKRITEHDKEQFIVESFKEMNTLFKQLFDRIKGKNPNFTYTLDCNQNEDLYRIFLDGRMTTALKMWLSKSRYTSIKLSYGNNHKLFYGNSYNEKILCDINQNNELFLILTMNNNEKKEFKSSNELVQEIWRSYLSKYIR